MTAKFLIQTLNGLNDTQGNAVGIHHKVVPQNAAFPAVTYREVSLNAEYSKQGNNVRDVERWQIDVFHRKDTEVQGLFDQIRTLLEGWTGVYEGTHYNYTTLESKASSYEEDFNLHRITADFIFRKK